MSSLRVLKTFLCVARSGSMSAAADEVALTPAAVSLQIRSLEDDLGQVLFDRVGRTIILTATGHRLRSQCEQILGIYEQMKESNGSEVRGELSIGAVASTVGLLAVATLDLRNRYPELKITPDLNYSGDLSMQVMEGELDAALSIKSPRPLPSGLLWTPLYTEPLAFIANRASASDISRDELIATRLLLRPSRKTHTGTLVERYIRDQKTPVNDFIELNSLRTIVELVEDDVGISFLPLQRRASWTRSPSLRIEVIDDCTAMRQVGFYELESRSRLTSIVREALKTLVATDRSES
ncbi:LysR family transcriptional regulator [Tropicimonas sp. IMCC34011]|uniref:LysR family transcriptional regulator n=1 Tax=Tropicimonas sp. IMCC34011 TaxID=2248759 RepID=UPI000E24057A|nr:LysR family transcriptional regulator [Tropicimonas sp. IMCC34011]